jgi:NADPH:quinone reductase-like Zn-dependent oxidoreductase
MRIHRYGDPSVICDDDIPRPVPDAGEVLIRVAATSFNPSDIGLRRGLLRSIFPLNLPYTLGGEVSGTVIEVGADVRQVAVGDRVVGRLDGGGAAADHVVARVGTLVAAPASIPLAHAAAIPIAGLTAWQAVFEHADVAAGQRVLVVGAGGGVGGFAVQLARHAGAYVIATASPRSAGAVRRLGADQVVDYLTTSLADAVDEPVDVILNLVVTDARQNGALRQLVRPGGVIVSATTPITASAGAAVTAKHFVARNDTIQLAALVRLVDTGAITVDISASYSLTDLAEVHRIAEAGGNRGKVILSP